MGKKQTDEMPHLTRTEAIILDLLVRPGMLELYGLEIVNASHGSITRGSVYVLLSRMEDKGLVTSRKEAAPEFAGGLPRVMYKATGLGQRAFGALRAAREVWRTGLAFTPEGLL